MTDTTIEVRNVGPVEEFSYTLGAPGLHVLRGHQGAGKTTILRTAQLAADGRTDVKPTSRDGVARGEATIAGKTLVISRRIREEGEISVDGLGDLDIAALHSPKYVDAKTRDRHRIRTLVRLGRADADIALFHDLLPSKEIFEEIVPSEAAETTDLVEMAAQVKRAVEKAAKLQEQRAETARANMRVTAAVFEGVDLTQPCDEEPLTVTLHEAIQAASRLKQQRADAQIVQRRAKNARESLEKLGESQDPEGIRAKIDAAEERREAAAARVAELEKMMVEANAELASAISDSNRFRDQLQAAERQREAVQAWETDIEAAESAICPTEDDLAAAEKAINSAQAALKEAAEIRKAITAKEANAVHAQEALKYGQAANRLRDAARDTMTILTEAVKTIGDCPLRVIETPDGDPRLVLETDRSESELFDDLSDGERWPHIIGLAAAANRLIVLPQAAYGELSPETRALLDRLAKEHECYILTAQVDDGELRAEPWAPGEAVAP